MKPSKLFFIVPIGCTFNLLGQKKPNVLFIAIDDLNDYVELYAGCDQRSYT